MSAAVFMILFWLGFSRFDMERDLIVRRHWRKADGYYPKHLRKK